MRFFYSCRVTREITQRLSVDILDTLFKQRGVKDTYNNKYTIRGGKMETYIVQARCQFSGYTDIFKVQADSAGEAVEKWSRQQGKIGINTEYRWPNPRACKLEHFKSQHVYTDNLPVNLARSGNNSDDHEFVKFSELTKADRQDAIEWLSMERNFEKEFAEDYKDGIPF